MEECPDAIVRQVIDCSGRLGHLYDATRDVLLDKSCVKSYENSQFLPASACKILKDAQPDGVMNILRAIKFNSALLQSILLGTVKPSGISAFINYNQPIDENTRVLYYSYKYKEEELPVSAGKADKVTSLPLDLNNATHMVTRIVWGFQFLCVIQNPNQQTAKEVEDLLSQLSDRLKNCDKALKLTDTEKREISELSNVTIFGSETCFDNPSSSLLTVLTRIQDWQRDENFHCPTVFTLYPLKWLYKDQQFPELYHLSDQDHLNSAQVEPMIRHLDVCLNDLNQLFKNLPKNFISFISDRRLNDIPKEFGILLSMHEQFRKELANMLVNWRRDPHRSIDFNSIILDARYLLLRKPKIDVFHSETRQWSKKIHLIKRFHDNKINYINALDVPECQNFFLTKEDIDAALENYFSKGNNPVIIWCSSDRLKREKKNEWEDAYQKLISEGKRTTPQIPLVYVDFSQCQQRLEGFIIIRFPQQSTSTLSNNHPRVHHLPSAPQEPPPISSLPPERSPQPVTEINVLLLGETGVGKSTLINAFVNYLMFDTLQQAEQSEPVVLIPVSFLTTIGDQFQEFIVKFGDSDTNEDHEHQGQSVTQQCKSYVFNLNDKLRLRLIDTPGMGDTRGLAQDDKNINHILTYINNLSHLNAICLLFKPNASRLNIFFRSCINQLLSYLTPIGYGNIMFCFTNARSTFYAPGDTGPLLRQMLKQEHHDDIPFQKKNTFCFDSESFRYLAARKRGVDFDEFQTEECLKSWTASVTESMRLLNSIVAQTPYFLDEWQSPKKAVLEISILARPLMEMLRLILYNWKLREAGLIEKEMVINTNPVTIEMCSNCAQSQMVKVGPFYIIKYGPVRNKPDEQCLCPFDETNFLIEFTVTHAFVSRRLDASTEQFQTFFHDFLFRCDRIIHFLQQKDASDQYDPFKPVLERFLEEEQQISENENINQNMNKRIKEGLRSIKQMRQRNKQKLLELNEKLSVKDVYKAIDDFKTTLNINEQIKCIKTSRRLKMEANEHHVMVPPIKNKILATLTNSFQ